MKILRLTLCALFTTIFPLVAHTEPAQLMIPPIPLFHEQLPQDASFIIVDLKYNGKAIKICELGQGGVSGFFGHQRLFGVGKIWANVWKFLASLELPLVCFIPEATTVNPNPKLALDELIAHGGSLALKTLPSLAPNTILASTRANYLHQSLKVIKKEHPQAIILDAATRPFVLNKVLTHILFKDDPELATLRPRCKILPKHYTNGLAWQIMRSIPAERYVIKPINGTKGDGIIFTERKNLDTILKAILTAPYQTKRQKTFQQKQFSYWQHDENAFFIIESCEPSEPITVRKKQYDATMRIAMGLAYINNTIKIDFFGAYWKLPQASLDQTVPLERKHKSHIEPGTHCSAPVDDATYAHVKRVLEAHMPKLYLKMLVAGQDAHFISFIRQQIQPKHQRDSYTSCVDDYSYA